MQLLQITGYTPWQYLLLIMCLQKYLCYLNWPSQFVTILLLQSFPHTVATILKVKIHYTSK